MKLFLRAFSLFVVSVLSLFAAEAKAATTVSGAINFDQTWTAAGSPYILDGSVSVASGVTLTVQSGVTVQARSSVALTYELLVNGNLVVSGTTGSPVIFTSQGSAANQWKGIRIASTGTVNLANTQINNVDSALRLDAGVPATALTVNGLKVERMNNTAVNLGTIASTGTYTLNGLDVTCNAAATQYGVQVGSTTPGTLTVNNSRFKDCYAGVYQTATNLAVDHSIFTGGRHGIYFYTSYYGSVSTTVTYSTFYNVGTTSAEGAVVGSRYASTGYNAYVYLSDSLFGASQNVFRDLGSASYPTNFSSFNRNVVWSTVFSQSASFSTFLRYNALLKDPANGDFTPTERSPARYYFPADPTKTLGAVPYAGDPTGAGLNGFWYTSQIFAPGSVTDTSGVAGLILYYQPTGAGGFSSLTMAAAGGDLWTAIIPSSAVVAPGLSYYIRATDASPAANASNSPAGGLHSFTVNAPVTDTAPPTIGSSLVADGQIAGLPVTVSAAIVDASGVSRATLYFRTAGDTGWLSTAMTATGGNYTAEIPRLVVAAPAVEYYIEAVDGSTAANRGTDPAGAPAASHRFTVVVPDTAGPAISLLPLPLTVEEGTPVTVSAEVTDPSGIGEVTLFFRTVGASSWFSQRLTLAAGRYEAVLPGSVVAVPGLELYLEATDAVGNLTEEPTTGAADPILVEVTSSAIVDATAPTILHSPASSATYNRALSLSAIVSDASGVRSVTVWYRDLNALDWSFADLTDRGGNRWSGEVPAEALTTSQLSYFIEAFDLSGASNRAVDPAGAPTELYTLEVVGLPGDDVADTGADATDDTTADTTDDTSPDTEADTAPDTADDTTADGSGTTVEDTSADATTDDTAADAEEDTKDPTRPRATESGCAAAGPRSNFSSILFVLAGVLLFAVRAFRSIRARRATNRLSKLADKPR